MSLTKAAKKGTFKEVENIERLNYCKKNLKQQKYVSLNFRCYTYGVLSLDIGFKYVSGKESLA